MEEKNIFKFDGSDFDVWSVQILALLESKDLGHAILSRTKRKKPEGLTDEELEHQEKKAKSLLLLGLDKKIVRLVLSCATAKEIWEKLHSVYAQRSEIDQLILMQKFFGLKMEPRESVSEYLARAEAIKNELSEAKVTSVDEAMMVGKIVGGLPPRFLNYMSNWSRSGTKSLKDLLPQLMAEESLIASFKNLSVSNAHFGEAPATKKKGQDKRKSRQNDSGNDNKEGRKASRNKDKNKDRNGKERKPRRDVSTLECYACGEAGHTIRGCPKILERRNKHKEAKESKPESTTTDAEGFIAESNWSATSMQESKTWLLDSGCSDHMADSDCEYTNYSELDQPIQIKFGGGFKSLAVGIGDVLVSSSSNPSYGWYLKNVLHVPGIGRRLVSMGKLTQNGAKGLIESNHLELYNREKLLFRADRVGTLYPTDICDRKACALLSTTSDTTMVWHKRLAHLNVPRMLKMAKEQAVIGLESLESVKIEARGIMDKIDCRSCVQGKLSRRTVPDRTSVRASEVGEKIHVDVCGPFEESLRHNKYFVLFKDEMSNYRFVFCIKKKDQVFECIQKVFAQVTADTKMKVRKLFSDCGPEIINNKLNEFLTANSAISITSAPFHPSQNGIIERDNRTVLDAVRSMLFERKLPGYLWGEAVNTAVYILNRTTNSITNDKTPLELYMGIKPSLKHIRIFGCLAYMKPQEKKRSGYQKKLDPRGVACMLVGYARDYTYRLFSPNDMKIIITREAKFDEGETLEYEATHKDLNLVLQELYPDETTYETVDDQLEDSEVVAVSLLSVSDGPSSYNQAKHLAEWRSAMEDEYNSLLKNKTWDLAPLPPGRKAITTRWVYTTKLHPDGTVARYKARFVARGFSQVEGIDFEEIYAPVARMDSIRMVLACTAKFNWHMVQFDIRTAFLYGPLEEEIYAHQPQGFEQQSKDKQVLYCKLKKALYGLKQAPRSWNICFTEFLVTHGMKPAETDPCLMVKKNKADELLMLLILYVDDGLICGRNQDEITRFVSELKTKFETKVFSPSCFIGLEIEKSSESLIIHQTTYTQRVIKRFLMEDATTCSTPGQAGVVYCKAGLFEVNDAEKNKPFTGEYRALIGCLSYIANGSRPDISFMVNKLAAYSNAPKAVHWTAAKRILRYLKSTSTLGIRYAAGEGSLTAYSDADFAADVDTRLSTSGSLILLSGGPIMWRSIKQKTIASSTVNAEFVAAALVCTEIIWARQQLNTLGIRQSEPTTLWCDNQGAINLIRNARAHSKIKHIDVKLLFIREAQHNKLISVKFTPTKEQLADIFTKSIPRDQFEFIKNKMKLSPLKTVVCALAIATCVVSSNRIDKWSRAKYTSLELENSCDHFRELPDWWSAHEDGIIWLCNHHYRKRMPLILKKIANCIGPVREKRSMNQVLSVAAGTAVEVIGSGITNFLKSYFIPGQMKMEHGTLSDHSDLFYDLRKQTLSMLQSSEGRAKEMTRAVSVFSETSPYHPDELAVEAAQVDNQYSASVQIFFENIAGFANLRAIENHCKSGYLATRELGELQGNRELAEINMLDTRLDNVLVNQDEQKIFFIYRIRETHAIPENENSTAVTMIEFAKVLSEANRRSVLSQENSLLFGLLVGLVCFIPLLFVLIGIIIILGKITNKSRDVDIELSSKRTGGKKKKPEEKEDSD